MVDAPYMHMYIRITQYLPCRRMDPNLFTLLGSRKVLQATLTSFI